MISNPFNAGFILWNGRVSPGNHRPVVSVPEFERVQKLLKRVDNNRPKRRFHRYGGVFRCGSCDLAVTAEFKRKPSGREYTYYHCTRVHRTPPCQEKSVEERVLETQILEFLDGLSISEEVLEWVTDQVSKQHAERNQVQEQEAQRHRRQVASIERQIANLTALSIKDIIDEDEFLKKRSALQLELAAATEKAKAAEETAFVLEPLQFIGKLSVRAKYWYSEADNHQRQKILKTLCWNSRLKGQKALLENKKPFRVLKETEEFFAQLAKRNDVGTQTKRAKAKIRALCAKLEAELSDQDMKETVQSARELCAEFEPQSLQTAH